MKGKRSSTVAQEVLNKNFVLIKEALINSTGLQLFNPNETLFIYTDASDLGAGGIFLQKWEKDQTKLIPIAFYSKSFTTTQQKYATLERELLGIIMALTHNYLLLSTDIVVFTDHKALATINQVNGPLNNNILKFLEILSTYPLTIKYIPGNTNYADFVNRFSIVDQPLLDIKNIQCCAVRVLNMILLSNLEQHVSVGQIEHTLRKTS